MFNTSGHIFSVQAVSAVARSFFDTHSNPTSTRREPQQDTELPKVAKRKATKAEDPDAHYKCQETNKERGRLLTLASLGASSTDRQRAAARVVDTTHIIKRGIIRYPRDRTPLLERYKPRAGHLTTGSHKPAPPAELITSNAVPPPSSLHSQCDPFLTSPRSHSGTPHLSSPIQSQTNSTHRDPQEAGQTPLASGSSPY